MPLTRFQATLILLAIFFLGCGGKAQLKSVPVNGKVVGHEGKSVGPIIVIFWPEDSKNNRMKSAVCEADGSFHLECPPGNYKVTVSPVRSKGATAPPSPQGPEAAIPARYQSELTTTLNVKVPETRADDIILNLK